MYKVQSRELEDGGERMTIIEPGRICMKIAGREGGSYCVVVEQIDVNFVLVTGPKAITGIKRRRCNVAHLEPTEYKLELSDKEDTAIERAWRESGLIEKLGIKIPIKKMRPKKAEK
jgi:large subunit ribosomal protein L14e